MTRNLNILVVDDTEANRRLICRFVATLGYQAIPATDGNEAVALCRQQLPDLVLMDIMMPGMDGIETSLELRKLCGHLWLPIIFLSARAEEADQLHGLGFGDDYLPKPVNLAMLEARINVMARIAEMQQRLADNARRLEAYRRDNELELSFTRHLLERIMGNDRTQPGPVEQWIKPAHKLSGDVISHAYAPTGTLHLLLADSTGHGPAAAIGALPAVDAFQSMTRRGFDIGSIAREINAKLHCLLPRGHFVSAALLCLDPYHRRILAWNGGIPVVLHVDVAGRPLHQWTSRNPPLGILPDSEFTPALESCPWDGAGQLYLGSDGVTEAENAQGQRFGQERLLATLAENGGEHAFERLIGAVTGHLGAQDNHDDIALACVRCAPEQFQPRPSAAGSGAEAHPFCGSDWSLSLRFSAQELRQQDSLPRLVAWLNQLGLNGLHLQQMLLIITELYNNAMDHGVLRLDSTLKLAPQGFEAYLAQRDARLAALHHGHIDISLEHQPRQQRLYLRVQDSGAGFNHAAVLRGMVGDSLLPYGRGLRLVRELASRLEYNEHGNQAIVEYLL